jgi:hypothetical protein
MVNVSAARDGSVLAGRYTLANVLKPETKYVTGYTSDRSNKSNPPVADQVQELVGDVVDGVENDRIVREGGLGALSTVTTAWIINGLNMLTEVDLSSFSDIRGAVGSVTANNTTASLLRETPSYALRVTVLVEFSNVAVIFKVVPSIADGRNIIAHA